MLGLRFFKNAQIDLWQGDPALFVCDKQLSITSVDATSLDSLYETAYSSTIDSRETKCRHCAFFVPDASNASQIMSSLKSFLERKPATTKTTGSFSRLTFIGPSEDVYDALQNALFDIFEDDLNDQE